MILQRLYQLAEREHMLDDPAFVRTPIQCVVTIARNGSYLGLIDVRQREEVAGKRGGPPKIRVTGGRSLLVPVRPVQWDKKLSQWKTTDPAAAGEEKPAVFLADTIARVLPVERLIDPGARAKFLAQRSTFWRFLKFAANQTKDVGLNALAALADEFSSAAFQERLATDVERSELGISDLCSFAWEPDGGQLLLERPDVRTWWRQFYTADAATQQAEQFRGLCQLTEEVTAIAPSIKSKISGLIPVGGRAETYLVTGLTSAESYNLEGAVSGMISSRGVDGFTRALNALIANELPSSLEVRRRTSQRVGNVMFLFWTREPADTGFDAIFGPTTDDVDRALKAVHSGQQAVALTDENQFYMLGVSGNSARVVVRDYLETPLPRVKENLAAWFRDLRIADSSKDGAGKPTAAVPLWLLAASTALDMDQVAPDTPSRLVHAAVHGGPISDSILTACLRRLRAEGSAGFRTPRMALIKLTLLRRKILVSESLNPDDNHPAYVCGRLLAVFEQIQYAALGDVNANVTDKFFGTFSAAPAMLLGRLYDGATKHLRKLRGDKPGAFVTLDRLLTEVSSQLTEPPKGKLSLHDQGRFALGYYHQKARRFEEIAERQAAKAHRESAAADVVSQ
jgi:CRISPR-associated protein Csd1